VRETKFIRLTVKRLIVGSRTELNDHGNNVTETIGTSLNWPACDSKQVWCSVMRQYCPTNINHIYHSLDCYTDLFTCRGAQPCYTGIKYRRLQPQGTRSPHLQICDGGVDL